MAKLEHLAVLHPNKELGDLAIKASQEAGLKRLDIYHRGQESSEQRDQLCLNYIDSSKSARERLLERLRTLDIGLSYEEFVVAILRTSCETNISASLNSSPDLVIVLDSETSLGGTLIPEIAYSEIYFAGNLAPEQLFQTAFEDYASRGRNFGA